MADSSMTIQMPRVTAAAVSPSPAVINSAFTLRVTVEEASVTLEPELHGAGEFYSGEV